VIIVRLVTSMDGSSFRLIGSFERGLGSSLRQTLRHWANICFAVGREAKSELFYLSASRVSIKD
jgi:hypothetical protein